MHKYLYIPLSKKQIEQLYYELTGIEDVTLDEIDEYLNRSGYKLKQVPYWAVNHQIRYFIVYK